jgi:uncharacterized protein (DUF849 family)
MSNSSNDLKNPYEWIKSWGTGDELISDESYGEEEMSGIKDPKMPTMDKKVIIEAAITGWQPIHWWRDRGVETLPPGSQPGPTCIPEQVAAIKECVDAGAACIHMHPRHPEDGKARLHDTRLTAEIIDRAYEEVEDFIPTGHSFTQDFRKSIVWDFITPTREFLELGKGNRYVQTSLAISLPTFTERHGITTNEALVEAVEFFEANDIRPNFSVEPFYFSEMKRLLFDTGIAKTRPYLIELQFGKHRDDLQFVDPWSFINVITSMEMVRDSLPEEELFLGLHPGGRNWLPTTVVGFVNGAQLVRVGIEDLFWLWPHRDDIPQSVSHTVQMIVDLCKVLGREVATVAEARQIMNVHRTS